MIRNILFTILLSLGALGVSSVSAAPAIEIVDAEFSQVSIIIEGSSLRVTGATGLNLYVYNITGVRVLSVKVDGADKSYNLNLQKGCYIVKVGNVVRKISIK